MFELIPMNRRMPMYYRPMKDFDEMFDNTFRGMMNGFSTDIIDTGDAFELNAELPGFKKEDIKISLDKETLTVSAERKSEDNEEKPNFIKRERYYGSYSRSFDLTGIDKEKIEAEYADGILKLTLPKIKEPEEQTREIAIK